jgi:hypothetical protein
MGGRREGEGREKGGREKGGRRRLTGNHGTHTRDIVGLINDHFHRFMLLGSPKNSWGDSV